MFTLLAQVDLGTISPPPGVIPDTGGDPSEFVAVLVRNGIWLLIVVGAIIFIIWMIFAGYGLIFAGDDPKKVASSWSKIYLGLLGMVIIVGVFAIIKLVEDFFGVSIVSQGIDLPTIR